MKKLISLLALLPSLALAHGTKIDVTSDAVVGALKQFETKESEELKSHFRGVKAWPSGDKISVVIYVNQEGADKTINYSCTMDHSGGHDEVVCKKL